MIATKDLTTMNGRCLLLLSQSALHERVDQHVGSNAE